MEKPIGANKWEWLQLTKNEMERGKSAIDGSGCDDWLEQVRENRTNCLRVEVMENGEKVVKGSLIYQQNFQEERDYQIFHFHVSTNQLLTVDLMLSTLKHINPELLHRQIEQAENAVDGFLIFLGELMNEMLVEIDRYEEALKTLVWSIRKRNEMRIFELVYSRRHELLVWKSLLIPIMELRMAMEELNFKKGESSADIFTSTCKRIERAMALLNEYEHEMDAIIKLEEVISSHRGNEIMKTLTVITTIFTPIMAFGALWGMNFKHMPELQWKYSYLLSILVIVVSTLLLYGYLKIKGWTGDLLKGKKKGSFFK